MIGGTYIHFVGEMKDMYMMTWLDGIGYKEEGGASIGSYSYMGDWVAITGLLIYTSLTRMQWTYNYVK